MSYAHNKCVVNAVLSHKPIENKAAYFSAAEGTRYSSPEEKTEKIVKATKCLLCMDRGLLTRTINLPGGTYDVGYACSCEAGHKYTDRTEPITSFENQTGFFQCCQVGGHSGQYCHLPEFPDAFQSKGKVVAGCLRRLGGFRAACRKFHSELLPDSQLHVGPYDV